MLTPTAAEATAVILNEDAPNAMIEIELTLAETLTVKENSNYFCTLTLTGDGGSELPLTFAAQATGTTVATIDKFVIENTAGYTGNVAVKSDTAFIYYHA